MEEAHDIAKRADAGDDPSDVRKPTGRIEARSHAKRHIKCDRPRHEHREDDAANPRCPSVDVVSRAIWRHEISGYVFGVVPPPVSCTCCIAAAPIRPPIPIDSTALL